MYFNFGKWCRNFESSGTLLSKVVELWQLSQLYNFAKLRKLLKVQLDVFLMNLALIALPHYDFPLKGRYDKYSYRF